MSSSFLDPAPPVAFAHRGFAVGGAENSMAAFADAVALGYRYVETDARVTADGVAVAFHDDVLNRVTDRRGVVSALPWSVVSQARIAGREPIPRLEEVLGAWPDLLVNIDIKSDCALAPALEAVRRTRAGHRVCLAAFSDARLAHIRRAVGPDVCTGLGPREVVRLKLRSRLPSPAPARRRHRPPVLAGRCVQIPAGPAWLPLLDRALVAAAHAGGAVVHVWTVNDEPVMHRLLDLGVDGIMTDRADRLREVLITRGQWSG